MAETSGCKTAQRLPHTYNPTQMENHYGYVPLAHAAELKEAYAVADPHTWQFMRKAGPAQTDVEAYGGVEDTLFSPAQKAELVALGGGWFANAAAFLAWRYQHGEVVELPR